MTVQNSLPSLFLPGDKRRNPHEGYENCGPELQNLYNAKKVLEFQIKIMDEKETVIGMS